MVGIGRSVGVADMPLLAAVVDSRLRVAVGWRMVPVHSRWPLSEVSEPQYMTWVIGEPPEPSGINSSPLRQRHVINQRNMAECWMKISQKSVKIKADCRFQIETASHPAK